MKLNGVIIRSKEQLEQMSPQAVDVLKWLVDNPGMTIPVIYQYLHNPKQAVEVTDENRMGWMSNVRMNNGDIVGDLEIFDILKIASNFTGVIDNFAVTVRRRMETEMDKRKMAQMNRKNESPIAYQFDAFIIYDKSAKERILANRKRFEERLAEPGTVPLVADEGTGVALKNATEEILEDFRRRFGLEIQPDDNTINGGVNDGQTE